MKKREEAKASERARRARLSKKQVLFIVLFSALALVADRINVSSLVGAPGQFFTLFQFFGPIAGAFLGAWLGIAAVLGAEVANFVLLGKALTAVNIMRLFPMLFATWYFAKGRETRTSLAVPAIAMAAFILHPVGREAWFFSLYWTIPVIARLFFSKSLFMKSLGTTFTAHAVGGAAWAWMVPMPAEAWIALIPVVAIERFVFALGITGSFVAMNSLLAALTARWRLEFLSIEPRYVFFPDKARK